MDQSETPYFDALLSYAEAGVRSLHMPGHQQGRGAGARFRAFMEQHALRGDITQVLGMDDVHRPTSVCLKAQELAADAYGADRTYFLVNGASSGNQAMLLGALRPGQTVLMPRNAHRSALGAAMLAGVKTGYYDCPYDADMGVLHAARLVDVQAGLARHPEAAAIFLTTPTYYGAVAEVDEIVAWAHGQDRLVLVDEAWGAHLAFHPALPRSALAAGADLVVQSVHKLLAGLSQAAWLHLRGERVDRPRLEAALRTLLSTSPSTLLLASLDTARHQMVYEGRRLWGEAIALAERAREAIGGLDRIRSFGIPGGDPTRLVFSACPRGLTGYQVERHLRERHNLQLEMVEVRNGVALVTPGHTWDDLQALVDGLHDLPTDRAPLDEWRHRRPPLAAQALSLREAFDAPQESVALAEAQERVSAELITVYPPGIPIVCPGEVIGAELIEYVSAQRSVGANIEGSFDPELETVRVVCR